MAEHGALSEDELVAWGRRIASAMQTPLVLALRGDLGAGKTTLARAIARGAGVEGEVPSPTFNLVFSYRMGGGGTLHHFDLYRLTEPDQVWELGWEEIGSAGDLAIIEWPERVEVLLPVPRWDITLSDAESADRRSVAIAAVGNPPPLPQLAVPVGR